MTTGALGTVYRDGETIVRQGEMGDSMFVIQQGSVEVLREEAGTSPTWGIIRGTMGWASGWSWAAEEP